MKSWVGYYENILWKRYYERYYERDIMKEILSKIYYERDIIKDILWKRYYQRYIMKEILSKIYYQRDIIKEILSKRYYQKVLFYKWHLWKMCSGEWTRGTSLQGWLEGTMGIDDPFVCLWSRGAANVTDEISDVLGNCVVIVDFSGFSDSSWAPLVDVGDEVCLLLPVDDLSNSPSLRTSPSRDW